jgi:hypothetical protein
VKVAKAEAPKALAEELRTTLDEQSVSVLNADGTTRAQFWFRKEIPVRANAEQVKNGLTYREIPEGSFIGVVKFEKPFVDFRKQELPAGTYSMRLAVQPDTGDHKDTAPHQDFCLLVPIASEKNLETIETKDLVRMSLKVTLSDHPAVLLMFPHYGKDEEAKIVAKPGGVSVVQLRRGVVANEKPATLGFAFVVEGISPMR